MRRVYLDYAATTPVLPEVIEAMAPFWQEKFGNASSIHSFGREARQAIEKARQAVAEVLNCQPDEVVFTGTATASDNLAILGVAQALGFPSAKISLAASQIEHHGVLDVFKYLEKQGGAVAYLPVDRYGVVKLEALSPALTAPGGLVSVMSANNEVGTIEPIAEVGRLIEGQRKAGRRFFFHTDAAAAAEYLALDVQRLKVDLLTLGAHKFGGPKGVGLLFVRHGTPIKSLTYGGHHEFGLRPGTEATPLIVGAAKALVLASQRQSALTGQVRKLRDRLIKGVLARVPEAILTGHPTDRLPDIASFCFAGAEGEAMLLRLDSVGIAASSGSACTSGELQPSHVLLAMGISAEVAHGSVRFSLGRGTTKEEVDYLLTQLPEIVKQIRQMAPRT